LNFAFPISLIPIPHLPSPIPHLPSPLINFPVLPR
jgi:hypothetical protein